MRKFSLRIVRDDFELRLAYAACHGRRLATVQGARIAVSRPRRELSMRMMEVAALVARIFPDLRQRPGAGKSGRNHPRTADLFRPSV